MPSPFLMAQSTEKDAKALLLDACHSSASAPNLERIIRCLLQFWDPVKCALVLDKSVDVAAEIFAGLRYGPENVESSDLSSLSLLDIKVCLHLCAHCAYVRSERAKQQSGRFSSLATADQWTTDWQRKWWRAAWALSHNAGQQEDRARLQEGLEVIRLRSRDIPELPLLVSVAAMLESEVPEVSRCIGRDSKAVVASDYAILYWDAIDNILERDRVVQAKPDAFFYAGLPPLPRSRRDHYRSLAKYHHALNALMHGKEDDCVDILEKLDTPLALFTLGKIYKSFAQSADGRRNERDAALYRRAMLLKSREALRSCVNKLESQASSGPLNEVEITKTLDDVEASLAASNLSMVPSNGEVTTANQQQSDLCVTPLTQSTTGYFTPVSRFVSSRTGASTPQASASASASLLLELGHSVDYALRSLTQSQEALVRGVMDQNRALTTTCDNMISQLKELTLTNKALVDEMKDMRRENNDFRTVLSTIDTLRNRMNVTEDSFGAYVQPLPAPVSQFPYPVYSTFPQPPQPPPLLLPPSQPLLPPQQSSYTPCSLPAASLAQPADRFQQFPSFLPQQQQQQGFSPAMQGQIPMAAEPTPQVPPPAKPPLPTNFDAFKPKPGSWECGSCYVRNEGTATKCIACGSSSPIAAANAPSSSTSTVSTTAPGARFVAPPANLDAFKPKPGSWECGSCYIRNEATAPKCIACGSGGPGTAAPTSTSGIPAASTLFTSTTTTGGVAGARFAAPTVTPGGAKAFQFGMTPQTGGLAAASGAAATSSVTPLTSTPVFGITAPAATGAGSTVAPFASTPKFGFAPPATAASTSIGAATTISTPQMKPTVAVSTNVITTTPAAVTTTRSIFGASSSVSGMSFAALAQQKQPTAAAQPFQGFKGFGGSDQGSVLFGSGKASTPQRTRQESEHEQDESAESFEPNVDFKPVIPLPALVEAKSGEEEEQVLFKERAKLYRWDQDIKEFKERGVGDLKILKHPDTGAVRLLMRREQVLKICANHRIIAGMKLSPMERSDRAFTWNCQDYSEGELITETFAVKFKDAEAAKKFQEMFDSVADGGQNKENVAAAFSTPANAAVVGEQNKAAGLGGGNRANEDVAIIPKEVNVDLAGKYQFPAAPTFQPFQGFKGFGSAGAGSSSGQGSLLFGNMTTSTPQRTRQESEHEQDESAESFEPNVDFKPVVPLPALVETKSGEEDEQVLFKERAKLYRWEQTLAEFKERGLGDIKILKHPQTAAVRILMRREQVLKICANHRIVAGMKLSPMQRSADRAFTWNCQDYSEGELVNETLAVKFKDPEAAKKFKETFDSAASAAGGLTQSGSSATIGGDQKKPAASGGSNADEDIAIIPYEVNVNSELADLAAKYQLPLTFYVDRPPCPGCIGCASEEVQDEIFRKFDRHEE